MAGAVAVGVGAIRGYERLTAAAQRRGAVSGQRSRARPRAARPRVRRQARSRRRSSCLLAWRGAIQQKV